MAWTLVVSGCESGCCAGTRARGREGLETPFRLCRETTTHAAFNSLPLRVYSSAAAALLGGCGGSQPPIAVPGATTQASRPIPHADLLYVVMAKGEVNILSYPACAKVGTLKSAEHTDAPIVTIPSMAIF